MHRHYELDSTLKFVASQVKHSLFDGPEQVLLKIL